MSNRVHKRLASLGTSFISILTDKFELVVLKEVVDVLREALDLREGERDFITLRDVLKYSSLVNDDRYLLTQ
jgi:hypothetical protein